MADIEALYGSNVCGEEEKASCLLKIGEGEEARRFQASAYDKCKKKKRAEIHPWTFHLLMLRRKMKAGYPFAKDDLFEEEWLHLGLVNELIESKKVF